MAGVLLAVASGCGDDPCEEAAAEICARACECGGDSECPTTFTGESGTRVTLTFSDEEDCAALFRQGCAEETEDGFDGETCLEVVSGASCGEGGEGVLVPPDCA